MFNLQLMQIFSSCKCLICGLGPEEFSMGRFYKLEEFAVHHLCILTGSDLPQNGNSSEGLLGFLFCDIIKAYRIYSARRCSVCNKSGASLECKVCKRKYHLPCGINSGEVVTQMLKSYPSYCQECIVQELMPSKPAPEGSRCAICLSTFSNGQRIHWCRCCKSNEWMHVNCLQRYALMAGYMTKCPLCANKRVFKMSLTKNGIYIPREDAVWLADEQPTPQPQYILQCSAKSCVIITGRFRSFLMGCAVCRDILGHYECTFAGVFMCNDCTKKLWPEDCLSLIQTRTVFSNKTSRSIFLLTRSDKLKATFPWLLNLLTYLIDDPQAQIMLAEIIEKIEKELQDPNRICLWYDIDLTDKSTDVLMSKIKECHDNYLKKDEVMVCPNMHPADEDLREIELETLRRATSTDMATEQEATNAAEGVSIQGPSAQANEGGRLTITEQLLNRLKHSSEITMELLEVFSHYKCVICGLGPDKFKFGKYLSLQEFSVHYLCVLTGTDSSRTKELDEGLIAFSVSDIIKASRIYCRRICLVCKKAGASLKCDACRRTYHLPCGMNNKMLVEMIPYYRSYCRQCIVQEPSQIKQVAPGSSCPLCFSSITNEKRVYWPICCKSQEGMHIDCIQRYATMAGRATKCPLCANDQEFKQSVRKNGVYIPNEDADWSSRASQQIFSLRCSAEVCSPNITRSALVWCSSCRECLSHYECTFRGIFICVECTRLLWPSPIIAISNADQPTNEVPVQAEVSESLSILTKNEIIKGTFPWLLNTLNSLANDKQKQSEKVVEEVVTAINKELCKRRHCWCDIPVSKESRIVIVSKINAILECYKEVVEGKDQLTPPNPADEDLKEIGYLESLERSRDQPGTSSGSRGGAIDGIPSTSNVLGRITSRRRSVAIRSSEDEDSSESDASTSMTAVKRSRRFNE